MRFPLALCFLLTPVSVQAGGDFVGADVVWLGELHDNPTHHARQAEIVADLVPTAVVYEMLTAEQAARVTPDLVADEVALEVALGWNDSGWPDFAMYYPIFAAAPEAAVYGAAVPRDAARRSMAEGVVAAFSGDAALYGLDVALPEDQQAEREALQLAAHCDAMPDEMLPVMVDIQRLRDAELAHAALEALRVHGPPVVVITGNGHARTDWGAPVYLAQAAPEVVSVSYGQGEDGAAPVGRFDMITVAAAVPERDDPCAAFR